MIVELKIHKKKKKKKIYPNVSVYLKSQRETWRE